jgi:hypothetical protein
MEVVNKMTISREQFEELKKGVNPKKIGLDYNEAISELCTLLESANDHLKRVNILRKKYLKLDDFICDEVMKSCIAIKGGISEKESIKNIFNFYEKNN